MGRDPDVPDEPGAASKDSAFKDSAFKDSASKDSASKDSASEQDTASQDTASQDTASQDTASSKQHAVAKQDGAPEWAVPGVTPARGPFPHAASQLVSETVRLTEQFAAQAEAVDLEQQLVMARRLIEQMEARWLMAAADFESNGGVGDSGAASLGGWMRRHCHMTPSESSARARVAHAVTSGELPATAQAMLDGDMSWRQAQVVGNAVRQLPEPHQGEAEQALVEWAGTLDPGELRKVGDELLHCFDREQAEAAAVRRFERRSFNIAETIDGLVAVSGLLDPITGALLMTAIDTKMRPPAAGAAGDGHGTDTDADTDALNAGADGAPHPDLRTWGQRRADALGEICAEWLESDNTATVGGVRPHVSVIVDVETLKAEAPRGREAARRAWLSDSPSDPPSDPQVDVAVKPGQLAWVGPITATEAQLISCDATVSRILMDGPSSVLDVGRATRTIPPAIRRAVIARDRECAASGCHRPPEHCDVHHVRYWSQGGNTSLDNTVLVCRRHHRMIHQLGWSVTVDATGRRSIGPP